MEDRIQAKDISALWSKAGQTARGTYREFNQKSASAAKEAVTPSKAHAPSEIENARKSIVAATVEIPRRPAPALDRLLASKEPRKEQPSGQSSTTIALFSLAGGAGKTTIVSVLGRLLSGRNRKVVLANCGSKFAFEHLINANAQTIGAFTFLHPQADQKALPLTLVDAGELDGQERHETLKLIQNAILQADSTFLDLPSCHCTHFSDLLRVANHVLVPLQPDMHSAVTLRSIESALAAERATGTQVHYILNRYDSSRASHREMRHRLEDILEGELLPICIREESRIQDAMRSGLTIVDYAPNAEVVADFTALCEWADQLVTRSVPMKGRTA